MVLLQKHISTLSPLQALEVLVGISDLSAYCMLDGRSHPDIPIGKINIVIEFQIIEFCRHLDLVYDVHSHTSSLPVSDDYDNSD